MNIYKTLTIICACILIVYFTWLGIMIIGTCTLLYLGGRIVMNKFKDKIGKIFN